MIAAPVFPAAMLLQQATSSGMGSLTLLLPVFVIAMVLMTAIPNNRKQKKWKEMLDQLKPGDTVTTVGGLRGQILNVREEVITLRVAPDNIKLEFVKSAIASVTTAEEEK